MFYVIIILAGIFAMPAKALDGTSSPANVAPPIWVGPTLNMPDGEYWHNPNLLEEFQRLAQATPGGSGVDPLIGTWKLNAAKSTGSPWRSLTITFTVAEGQNLIAATDGVNNQGQQLRGTIRHTYDGMPHPTDGSPDADATIYTRLEDTISIVRFKQGKVAEVSQSIVVPNKTYTNTGILVVAATGKAEHFVLVFDRQ
jgi:hypothetical protein